jgi:hypothetical protein
MLAMMTRFAGLESDAVTWDEMFDRWVNGQYNARRFMPKNVLFSHHHRTNLPFSVKMDI